MSPRQLSSSICRRSSVHLPLFCLKTGYKFSYWRQTFSPETAPEESANKPSFLSFLSYNYFPQLAALRNLKLFSFVLLFLYKFIALCWRLCISWCSKLPLGVTFHELSPVYHVQSPLINCFSLVNLSFCLKAPAENPRWDEVKFCLFYTSCGKFSVSFFCYLPASLFCHKNFLFKMTSSPYLKGYCHEIWNAVEIYLPNECPISVWLAGW